MDLGRVGIWSIGLRSEDPARRREILEAAAELEELGYGAIWLGGSPDVSHAIPLIEATHRIVVATGILNIWDHDAAEVAARRGALAAAHPGRFLLGLGASHAASVGRYDKPYSTMVGYLDRLDAASPPVPKSERVLAALGQRMLQLSGDRAAGAHPYLVTPQHTRQARVRLGAGPLLAPEVKVILETDPEQARTAARRHLAPYLHLPNYTNNLLRLGFTAEDLSSGGSDQLIDAIFAWGDLQAVRKRLAEFHNTGADHVCVQVITDDRQALPRPQWRELAAALDFR